MPHLILRSKHRYSSKMKLLILSLWVYKNNSFLKIFRIQLCSRVLYMGVSPCSTLKCGICGICKIFCVILMQYFTQNLLKFYLNAIQYVHLITIETITWLQFYVLSLSFMFWFTVAVVTVTINFLVLVT